MKIFVTVVVVVDLKGLLGIRLRKKTHYVDSNVCRFENIRIQLCRFFAYTLKPRDYNFWPSKIWFKICFSSERLSSVKPRSQVSLGMMFLFLALWSYDLIRFKIFKSTDIPNNYCHEWRFSMTVVIGNVRTAFQPTASRSCRSLEKDIINSQIRT